MPSGAPLPVLPADPRDSDAAAGFAIGPDFVPFAQRNDVFRRSWWDPAVRSAKTDRFYKSHGDLSAGVRGADGFTQRDYALRNAAWHVSDLFTEARRDDDRREGFSDPYTQLRPPAAVRVPFDSPEAAAREVKRVARAFGAGDVGVTARDERFMYSARCSDLTGTERPVDIDPALRHVIVIVMPMDRGLLATVPSALSGAATGLGYSHDAMTLLSVAQYLRNLGYQAVPSANDSALAIPLAIKAGLGEYGRLGLLINPHYGPRLRLGKIFTDLPLAHDAPRGFGVRAFCEACRACADGCPVKAIPQGAPGDPPPGPSYIKGIRKWTVDAEKCFGYWANQGTDCAICIRVCPYNRDYSRRGARWWRWLAGTRWRRVALWVHRWSGGGRRVAPAAWWGRG